MCVTRTQEFRTLAPVNFTLLNVLLIANAIYDREFLAFLTVNAMLASSETSAGRLDSALKVMRVTVINFTVDSIILIALFACKLIHTY
ncbi:hypothetical protein [Streptococcus hyointestinalis]|uniref:hypothetical protein n=1 Tax=Streptococcus hyointestinalis TaxID=1337 RepID=UPI0013E0023E|nr:hypothetical protein [Streptococcus hyointestinalis]